MATTEQRTRLREARLLREVRDDDLDPVEIVQREILAFQSAGDDLAELSFVAESRRPWEQVTIAKRWFHVPHHGAVGVHDLSELRQVGARLVHLISPDGVADGSHPSTSAVACDHKDTTDSARAPRDGATIVMMVRPGSTGMNAGGYVAQSQSVDIKDLSLDLNNYRMTPQASESESLYAMVSIGESKFWALVSSIIEDGYHPNEALIVLKEGADSSLVVKEGNRRLAAMKLIAGELAHDGVETPDAIRRMLDELPAEWHAVNDVIPCVIYEQSEKATVDRLVRLIHGKGEQAAREKWNPIARARHNRQENSAPEPGLDLLEKYLAEGLNVSPANRAAWSGNYQLSILDEAATRIAKAIGVTSKKLADLYPAVEHRAALETILHDIGEQSLGFPGLRNGTFPASYGIGVETSPAQPGNAADDSPANGPGTDNPAGDFGGSGPTPSGEEKPAATSFTDWKSVREWFRTFKPKGTGRQKVVQLRDEGRVMNVSKTPLAFCFLLRSMLELSAKAYCTDHAGAPGAPVYKKSNGEDRKLAAVLGDVAEHIIAHGGDKKLLHAAKVELSDAAGALSVTSLNNLIHNPNLIIDGTRVCMMFGHIAPLLKAMND